MPVKPQQTIASIEEPTQTAPPVYVMEKSGIGIASDVFITIIGSLILIITIIGLAKGWYRALKKFADFSNKTTLFINKMFPDILEHLCETRRIPKDSLAKWTKLISSNNIQSKSPLEITNDGYKTIKVAGIDKVFEDNKNRWLDLVKKDIKEKATKYDIENICINLIAKLFRGNDEAFDPIKNYLFENPNKLPNTDIYALLGLLLRDYIFKNHPNLVK